MQSLGHSLFVVLIAPLRKRPPHEPDQRIESSEKISACSGVSQLDITAELARIQATLRLGSDDRLPPFTLMGKSVLPSYSNGILTGFHFAGRRIQISTDSIDGKLGNFLVIRDGKGNIINVNAIDQGLASRALNSTILLISTETLLTQTQLNDLSLEPAISSSVKSSSIESSGTGSLDDPEFAPRLPKPQCEMGCDIDLTFDLDMCDAAAVFYAVVVAGFTGYSCSIPGACGGGVVIGGGIGLVGLVHVWSCKSLMRTKHQRCRADC